MSHAEKASAAVPDFKADRMSLTIRFRICARHFAVPPLLRCIQWRLFFVFGSFNMAAFIHAWFTAPETKQRTLDSNTASHFGNLPGRAEGIE
ncbi:hypothetical protein V1508DRAFT_419892, partial [Lipomyces doorenjongii]|uniref:uncharacterized protein n=1 Tax=Lipomyces doorenjongii TaxID=383834 RepID=UPI0034CD7D2E